MMESKWNGEGYLLGVPYDDGAEMNIEEPFWEFKDGMGEKRRVKGPREFRHNLGTVINSLVNLNFYILGLWEYSTARSGAEPGSWDHFISIAPPWITIWWELK